MDVRLSSRRLLSHGSPAPNPSPGPAEPAIPESTPTSSFSSFNANVVVVLSLLLCGVIVALVLNNVVQCALRATRRVCYGPEPPSAAGQERPVEARPAGKRGLRAIPALVYSVGLELAGSGSECAICLAEFARGEHVRVLPRCNHEFHVRCIDRWLAERPTCPTCRQAPFAKAVRPGHAVPAVQLQVDDDVSLRWELYHVVVEP